MVGVFDQSFGRVPEMPLDESAKYPFRNGGRGINVDDKKLKASERIRCTRWNEGQLIWSIDQYGRSIVRNCPRHYLSGAVNKERSRKMDIINLFWENVEWHLDNKELWLSEHYQTARQERASITLAEVGEIAAALAIDDYAILFEEIE